MRCPLSHKVEIKAAFKNVKSLHKVLEANGIKFETAPEGKTLHRKLYSGTIEGTTAFQLNGWNYPVVVDTEGNVQFDNFGGSWGNIDELHKVQQGYAGELSKDHGRKQGFRLESEKQLEDGSIQLTFCK